MRLACLLLLTATPALAAPQAIPGFASPESVLVAGDRAYVSNVGAALDPLAHDGDGFISLVGADGTILDRQAFPRDGTTLDAPKGMALLGATLYVADIDRIVGFDTEDGTRTTSIPLPPGGPAFANDLAAEPRGTLLVTDTLRNAVYRLDPAGGGWTLLTDAIPGANGIALATGAAGSGTLAFVAGIGAGFSGGDVFALDGSGTPRKVEGAPHGLLDGIVVAPDGTILVSDWVSFDPPAPGRITAVAPDGTATPLDLGPALQGPADFSRDDRSRLWIPAMPENAVRILDPAS